MVERKHHGELREVLDGYQNDILYELCYILGLPRSVPKYKKIENILDSEYEYEYIKKKLDHLVFGLIIGKYFTAKELKEMIDEFGLFKQRSKKDMVVEIIASEKVSPREMLGVLSTDDLHSMYHEVTGEDTDLDREVVIKEIIDLFGLWWLEGTKGKGFILMAMTEDPELEGIVQIIKKECEKLDIMASRVDDFHRSSLITDEIITEIRESEYLFVDLSKERPNVYYELGYAHGYGRPSDRIVLMAKKGEKIHFDIRNMRIIMYQNHDDLRKKLQKRLKSITK